MRVAYITMRFPAPSEAFAWVEIRALKACGVCVQVHELRPRLGESQQFDCADAASVDVDRATLGAFARDLVGAASHVGMTLDLMRWVVQCCWASPVHLLKSLVLVPRSIGIFTRIRRDPPNVVHLFWGHYPSLVSYLVGRYLPEVIRSVSLCAYDLRAAHPASAAVARSADVVRTHARANVPLIAGLGVPMERIQVAYRGIDLSDFGDPTSRPDPMRIATAGRLVPGKGMDDVLHAFRRVLDEWPEATLVILGDGPMREQLVQLAATLGVTQRVTFAGHVSQIRLQSELVAASVFLFLSKSETLPNVVKEAMASRCLCVASRTRGIDELIEDERTGFIVSVGDVERAAELVTRALARPERAAVMAAHARDSVVSRFDVSRTAAQQHQRWRALVEAGR